MSLQAFALVVFSALMAGASAQGLAKFGIWVPLYVDAGSDTQYQALIRSVEADPCLKDSFHGAILTGPHSRPPTANTKEDVQIIKERGGKALDPEKIIEYNCDDNTTCTLSQVEQRLAEEDKLYRSRYDLIKDTKQWQAFGYVFTRWSNRNIQLVYNDIDTWLAPGADGYGDYVQGIFVDQVATDLDKPKVREFYANVADYVKSYGKLLVFNPGTNWDECDFVRDHKQIDFLGNLENFYDKWNPADTGCRCRKETVCIASIHRYPEAKAGEDLSANIAQTLRTLANGGYGAAFLTERHMPWHYLRLPEIWPQVVEQACLVEAPATGDYDAAAEDAAAADAAPGNSGANDKGNGGGSGNRRMLA
ncbi:MAG: hypothetical protein J3K34DRAFT_516163 [Monoraphidium minutum]|nr:MAG: hypothetical protein J3K34DRAFT_516163 [Monoraphidium minutum]